jgi:hypothetical protein
MAGGTAHTYPNHTCPSQCGISSLNLSMGMGNGLRHIMSMVMSMSVKIRVS